VPSGDRVERVGHRGAVTDVDVLARQARSGTRRCEVAHDYHSSAPDPSPRAGRLVGAWIVNPVSVLPQVGLLALISSTVYWSPQTGSLPKTTEHRIIAQDLRCPLAVLETCAGLTEIPGTRAGYPGHGIVAGASQFHGRRCGGILPHVPHYRMSEIAELFGVSDDTVRRWADSGQLTAIRDAGGRKAVDGVELAAFAKSQAQATPDPSLVDRSARNRFVGLVTEVITDLVMAQVEIQCGPHRVVSLMSSEAVRELGLVPGVLAVAVVKSTQIMVETPGGRA